MINIKYVKKQLRKLQTVREDDVHHGAFFQKWSFARKNRTFSSFHPNLKKTFSKSKQRRSP
jgi:hypothetical protein